jgi:hypothetical protein
MGVHDYILFYILAQIKLGLQGLNPLKADGNSAWLAGSQLFNFWRSVQISGSSNSQVSNT